MLRVNRLCWLFSRQTAKIGTPPDLAASAVQADVKNFKFLKLTSVDVIVKTGIAGHFYF
jgi:hypothetical protein